MKKSFVIVIVFLFIYMNFASAALGITPAKRFYNFVPEQEIKISYAVFEDDPQKEIEIYTEGDLSQYVTLNPTHLTGAGGFSLTLKLPASLDTPGPHVLIVGAKEAPAEDQFLGTAINIRGIVTIFVPYPGRYVEARLNIPDVNIGEQLPVELYVVNRGTENLDITANIYFADGSGNNVKSLDFQPLSLPSSEEHYFRKYLDTSDLKSGNYLANAVVSYGNSNSVNKSFRIGDLFVNVTNYTTSLPNSGIQKYYVGIQSLWNNNVGDVYADVILRNESGNITFRTPSKSLGPWESSVLEGFIDTSALSGRYFSDIILSYAGRQTFTSGELMISGINYIRFIIISIVVLVIILALVVFIALRKYHFKRKK